ncbi:MAG: hypothetical protein JWM16_609 [Verrucomicrobiales bacterium]|nr:hypothetical protein [Verrucomicrobiales bacterium]
MYLACKSDASLDQVCASLEQSLGLDAFDRDAEDTWIYARSAGAGFGFNITRTDDTETISAWMQSAPHDVNYQLILSYYGTPETAEFQRVRSALQQALSTELQIYHEA